MDDIFRGQLVRLGSIDPQTLAEAFTRWNRDTEYLRLLDDEPARPRSVNTQKTWIEKELEEGGDLQHSFTIRTMEGDELIGFIGLFEIQWNHGNCWVGIGLGEREYWGKGYGTDAMRTVLRYAFDELDLERVTLSVFEYNPRAIRSYEKAGFTHEGRARQALNRDGERKDILFMGILRDEWKQLQRKEKVNDNIGT